MKKLIFVFFITLLADSIYQNRLGNDVQSHLLRSGSIASTQKLPSYEDQIRKFFGKKSNDPPPVRPNHQKKRRNLKMRFLKRF